MLEILAYANTGKVPKHHKLITSDIPGTVVVEQVDSLHRPGWNDRNDLKNRLYSGQWLTVNQHVVLVPIDAVTLCVSESRLGQS